MNSTPECWLPVVGWEALYEVSDQGRIRTIPRKVWTGTGWRSVRGRIRKLTVHHSGYILITLGGGQRKMTRFVHLLVLDAFIGPRPTGLDACHNDGDKSNNALSNLRWDTRESNVQDAIRHGTRPDPDRTECKQGHDLTKHRYINSDGYQACRECTRITVRRHEQKRRGKRREYYREYDARRRNQQ